ncbi:MATE family efflux transporter [Psychromonas hadalis]|uniref:MATE family efflux transporter n=1 Tax=Psychromonas hadalis TaxID=211669 RepID=UPI000A028F44|nr:MATE family efflux transporter [Psychromonas hadalis]
MMNSAELTLEIGSSTKQIQNINPLLSGAIPEQFIKLALPIIIALMINGLYSFVDAIFITRGVGINAMASVSAVFPINMIIISISAMLGSGMAAIISQRLDAGDKQGADHVFSCSLLFATVIGFSVSLLI